MKFNVGIFLVLCCCCCCVGGIIYAIICAVTPDEVVPQTVTQQVTIVQPSGAGGVFCPSCGAKSEGRYCIACGAELK